MKEVIKTKHVLVLGLVGVILLLGFVGQVKAQNSVWTSNGPYGGYICDIAISSDYASDQTIFIAAGSKGGYKSTDGGNSWIQVIAPTDYIRAIAVSPNYASDKTVFAGAYKSTDGGASWTETGAPINNITSFAISPNYAMDETIFVGSYWNQGVAKSSDGGMTWTLINSGFANLDNYSLAISPNYASDKTIFAGQGDGLYRSTNGGDTWERVLTKSDYPEALVLSPNYAVDQTIFVGFWNLSTYKSTNGGTTWISIGQSKTSALAISPDFSSDQTIFAGNVRGGVSKSIDGGITWTEVSNGLATSRVQSLAVSPDFSIDQTIFAGLGRNNDGPGIYKSTNGADSWSEANNGLNIGRNIPSLAFSPEYINDNTVFASSGGYQGDVFKSINNGDSWSMVGSGVGGVLAISPDYVNDETIFAAGSEYSVYKSTDGGNSWIKAGTGLRYVVWWDLAISPNYPSDQTIFVGGNAGVYKSTNGGTSWTGVNNGLTDTAINEIEISPNYTADQTIFAGGNNDGVFKSTDGGASWTPVSCGLPPTPGYLGPSVDALIISRNYQNDQTLFVAVWTHGVFKSTDGGDSWAQVNADAYRTGAFAVSPNYASDQTIFVATTYHYGTWRGVLKSIDGGATWSQLSNLGLPEDTYICNIAIPPNYPSDQTIFAGTRDGVWMTISAINVASIEISPTSHDFGTVNVGSTSEAQTFTVSNTGDADLVISTITLTGTDAFEFGIQNDNCSGQTIAPSESCTVDVVFSPTSEGSKNADLSIPSNDPYTPTLDVPLTGTGVFFVNPVPDVKANGSDDPIFITPSDAVDITVSLDPGAMSGERCDWWIGALTPYGTYWVVDPSLNWAPSNSPISVGQYPLFDLSEISLLDSLLPVGYYLFFFVLDDNPDGIFELTWHDYVVVGVHSEIPGLQTKELPDFEAIFHEKMRELMGQ